MSNRVAYLISCSEHYDHRFRIVDESLRARGYHTIYVTSDFDHSSKKRFVCKVPGSVQLPALAYQKNLSVSRIVSHFLFARDVFSYLDKLEQEPDLILALLPPNFLGHYLKKYKKRHPQVKLIFDIFDMWPETFPSGRLRALLMPVFAVWAGIRDRSLSCADWIITECELFRQLLGLPESKSSAIYLGAEDMRPEKRCACLREDGLDLCYLGAINNVIGIEETCSFLRELTAGTQVRVHIIGFGERQEAFIDRVKASGAEVVYYGAVYDEEKKQEIINRCHFGLNIMKVDACIGLTMKSVDYFRHGLPIINNIPADTEKLVNECGIGIQLSANCAERILQTSADEWLEMRENVCGVFEEKFSRTAIEHKYRDLLDNIL